MSICSGFDEGVTVGPASPRLTSNTALSTNLTLCRNSTIGTLQPGQHRLKLVANVITQMLQTFFYTVPSSSDLVASTIEVTNLPICKPIQTGQQSAT
ncbi:hypothetical protein DPMN_152824 [Dreissena polymorpha]|uniref:Uncharacterized protein n=1 Tax=Dreissena polymorpha TaxID=45954 RepID=A0A9D4J8A9_DREPO|nr:hypothetical protein DPMN_152824 [Dreissena polymorpha]